MANPRSFIDETIKELKNRTAFIEMIWQDFNEGKLSKEGFENAYTSSLEQLRENTKHEVHCPNNGCNYSDTNPEVEYFKTNNY